MQNDSSVRHIAVTCPQCGKHYKKVPYEAIKKYSFAFCKRCNVKFHITAAELEEALQQALYDSQPDSRAEDAPDSQNAPAFTGAEQPGGRPYAAAPAGQEQLGAVQVRTRASAQAAPDTAQQPLPEEPRDTDEPPPDTVHAPQAAAQESASLDQALEQKITDLAATMEETFNQPPAFSASDVTEGGAEELREDAAAAEPPFSINFEASDDASAFAPRETDNLQIESLPDFTTPADNGVAPPDELQTVSPAMAGEDIVDQTFMDKFTLPATEEQHAPDEFPGQPATRYPAGSAGEDQSADEELFSSILNMDLRAPVEQSAQDAGQDEFISPELTFSAPGKETLPEEFQNGIFIDTGTQQALDQDAAVMFIKETALFEELPAGVSSDDLPAAAPAQESFEEELLDESLIEDVTEPIMEEPFIEDIPDESLVEERARQNDFYPVAGRAGGVSSAPSDASFFDSLQDADGNRDVSAMLKQLVLPADEIEEGMEQFVLFTLGEQTFAAPIANVFELSLPPELIIVPNTPQWILGISNMRGEIISVIDFKGFLNIEPDSLNKPSRMIIVQTRDKQMVLGLMVDSISGIKYFSVDTIQPLEQQEPGLSDAFFLGACLHESQVVIFLDLEQILQSSKMRQFQ